MYQIPIKGRTIKTPIKPPLSGQDLLTSIGSVNDAVSQIQQVKNNVIKTVNDKLQEMDVKVQQATKAIESTKQEAISLIKQVKVGPQGQAADEEKITKHLESKLPIKKGITHLIRHGSTDNNGEGSIRGWTETNKNQLTDKGIEDVKRSAEVIKKSVLLPTILIPSDLQRAIDSAQIISEIIGIPIGEPEFGLRSQDMGNFTGKNEKKARPTIKNYALKKPHIKLPGGSESHNDFIGRVKNTFDSLPTKYPGHRIAVITHHQVERLVASNFGQEPSKMFTDGSKPGTVIDLDKQSFANDILSQVPKLDEVGLMKKFIEGLPKNQASLKIIQEKFESDPMSVIEKIMELPEGKFKLKTSQIDGLEQTIRAFQSQLGRGYLHGGGLSKVSHDATLTGDGTPANPLIVVDGGIGNPHLLATLTNVDLTVPATIDMYTIPNTMQGVVTLGVIRSVSASSVSVLPHVSFGITGTDNIISDTILTGFTDANKAWMLNTEGLIIIGQGGDILQFQIGTAATASSCVANIDLFGYLIN